MAGHVIPILSLLALSQGAAYCIIILGLLNGFFVLLSTVPSSSQTLAFMTGSPALDEHLSGLLRFFSPVASGESVDLGLFAYYIVGQLVAMHSLVLLEGLRKGNSWRVVGWTTLWGELYQTVPWGIIMPIYFAVYLYTSPIATSISSPKTGTGHIPHLSIGKRELVVLPMSLVLGLIIPTFLAGIPPPFLTTAVQQQKLLVFWQGFPVWIAVWQFVLTRVLSWIRPSPTVRKEEEQASMLKYLRRVYMFTLSLTALIHMSTLAFILIPSSRPEYFANVKTSTNISLKSVFIPMSPFSVPVPKVESVARGCQILLQYDMYFACGAALVWAAVMVRRVGAGAWSWGMLVKGVLAVGLLGPGGAALALVWGRDERVFGEEKGAKEE